LLSEKTECEVAPLGRGNSLLSLNPRFALSLNPPVVMELTLGGWLALVVAMCYTAYVVDRDASCV